MKVVLLAGYEFLSDKQNGGGCVSFRNYQLLCNIYGGENIFVITFLHIVDSDKAYHVKAFPKHKNKAAYFYNCLCMRNGYGRKSEREAIKYIIELNPDMIFTDGTFTGTLINKILKKSEKKCVVVAFMHNVEMLYERNRIFHESIFYLVPFLSYYYNEYVCMKKADVVIGLNERDKNAVKKIYGRDVNYILPVTHADTFQDGYSPITGNSQLNLLFLGSYFGPNIHGISWFVKEVMPRLPENVKLTIVGKDMDNLTNQLSGDRVEVVGTVRTTAVYYQETDAVVMPIFYGSGMKVKTAEAMMYGKYILGTREALEGYDVSGIEEIKECNSKEDFIKGIVELLSKECRSNFNSKVRERFLEKYETGAVVEQFTAFMNGIIKEI